MRIFWCSVRPSEMFWVRLVRGSDILSYPDRQEVTCLVRLVRLIRTFGLLSETNGH